MNPLSGLYGAGVFLRNTLFDRGVFRAHRLERPVVSVGNLSAGGSGKTPFVIVLGELLKERGVSFDVLSRGYGRNTRGVLVVDPSGSASDFGDEPVLIARKLGVPVVVGESRYEAGRVAESKFEAQLHLLDDGFQHRSLARDFDIVLMSVGDIEDRLLPIGRLREPISALRRADAIMLPQGLPIENLAFREKPIWRMSREIEIFSGGQEQTFAAEADVDSARFAVRLKSCPPETLPCPNSVPSPIVFCGIARPPQFFAQVRAAGIAPAAEVPFPDHYAYDERDIGRLLAMRSKIGAGGFLTTEKDAINLGPLRAALEPLALAALRVTLDRPDELVGTILARIAGRKPGS